MIKKAKLLKYKTQNWLKVSLDWIYKPRLNHVCKINVENKIVVQSVKVIQLKVKKIVIQWSMLKTSGTKNMDN